MRTPTSGTTSTNTDQKNFAQPPMSLPPERSAKNSSPGAQTRSRSRRTRTSCRGCLEKRVVSRDHHEIEPPSATRPRVSPSFVASTSPQSGERLDALARSIRSRAGAFVPSGRWQARPAVRRSGGNGIASHGLRPDVTRPRTGAPMNLLAAFGILVAADALAIAALLLGSTRRAGGQLLRGRGPGLWRVRRARDRIRDLRRLCHLPRLHRYDGSRSGAEAEALDVVQQFETAQSLPSAVRARDVR